MCLFVGDIGDNDQERESIRIYKVEEPNLELFEDATEDWDVVYYNYPNNDKYNAESMLIDAMTRELIIITKFDEPPFALVFKGALDATSESKILLEDTGITLDLIEATDASSSSDGQVSLTKSYYEIKIMNLILGCNHLNVHRCLFVA